MGVAEKGGAVNAAGGASAMQERGMNKLVHR